MKIEDGAKFKVKVADRPYIWEAWRCPQQMCPMWKDNIILKLAGSPYRYLE